MRPSPLLIIIFCLVWPTVAAQAPENEQVSTDEEDARVTTVAARQNAIANLQANASQLHEAGDQVKAARAWNRAGRFQLRLNKSPDAIVTYRQALDAVPTQLDPKTHVDSLNGLADVYRHDDKCELAEPLLDQAVVLSDQNGYVEGKAQALFVRVYCQTNKLTALEIAQQSLQLWQSTNHKLGQAEAYMAVGEHQMIQNNLIEATQSYETAQQLWQELNIPNRLAESLISLGQIEFRKGSFQNTLSFYTQAQQLITDEDAEPYMMGQIKAGLAEAFLEIGLPLSGLDRYREALDYFRQTNKPYAIAGMQWGIGSAHYFIGNYSEALAILKSARADAIGIKQIMLAALCDDFTGRSYFELHDYPAALTAYQAALDGFVQSGNPVEAGRITALMGRVYEQQGNFNAAKSQYLKALASFEKLSDELNESATLYALGSLALKQNSIDAAQNYLKQSIEMTDKIRRVSTNADLTAAFSARVHERYEKYIDCMMRKHEASESQQVVRDAFETSEKARARSLAELLSATQANLFPGLDPQLAAQERSLRGSLNDLENAKIRLLSRRSYQTSELNTLESEYQQLKAKHDQLIQGIRSRNPSYEQAIQPTAWDLGQIQQQVVTDDQTVLLEFSLGEEKSYLWAVTRSGIRSYELPNEKQIDDLARRVHKLLSTIPVSDNDSELTGAVQELARTILWPAAEHLNNHRIIVVPDGVLNYIPFQILPSPSSDKPLVEDREIVNAPSATTLGELQQEAMERQPAGNVLAAFGDPVFAGDYQAKEKDTSNNVLATAQLRSALRDNDLNDQTFDPTALTRLFHAKRELDSLREVAGERSLIVREYDATRERFLKTDFTQFEILHLVTHGYYNQKHPENSGLVLTDINRDQTHLQGFIGLRDIYELRAPVLLVVLSACQTALGENVRGEGIMGLTRGFMHAGASSVVASLWDVDDRATAELMKLFYSNMLEHGMKTGEALRAAQNSIRQRPEWRSPHYWAAFTLQGESPRAIAAHSGTKAWRSLIMIVVGLMLVTGVLLWLLRTQPQKGTKKN